MKVVITGAGGQLGLEMIAIFRAAEIEVCGYPREVLDITDEQQVRTVFFRERPNVIIHCAAYTHVDDAEKNAARAFLVNETGTRHIAKAAEALQAKLVYMSTDFVFNGKLTRPLVEEDKPDPQNVYGQSKLAGEVMVHACHSRFFIVRTSWLFGRFGSNFVKTMLRTMRTEQTLHVVTDQIGSPSYTLDVAEMVLRLVKTEYYGVYHLSNHGACTKYAFCEEMFKNIRGNVVIRACTKTQWPIVTVRPAYTALAHEALRKRGFPKMRSWQAALQHFLAEEM
ncbi:dTDP-4-dehydrorhamnose reductase [Bacillus sp. FSL W7-1360]